MQHTHLLGPHKSFQLHSIHMCRENQFQPKVDPKGSDLRSVHCSLYVETTPARQVAGAQLAAAAETFSATTERRPGVVVGVGR